VWGRLCHLGLTNLKVWLVTLSLFFACELLLPADNTCSQAALTVAATAAVLVGACSSSGPSYAVATECDFSCAPGFTASSDKLTCGQNGQWTVPTCAPNTCGAPTAVAPASVGACSGSSPPYAVGTECAFSCAPGFTASSDKLICGQNGQWTVPTCAPNTCGAPTAVAPASVGACSSSSPPYAVGAECAFSCAPGFTASSDKLTCRADGTWTTPACLCAPMCCCLNLVVFLAVRVIVFEGT
jgi:hypothetical protein